MAIQAQVYSENHGFPMCGSQDLMMMDSNGGFGQFGFNVQQQQQQKLQQHLQQQLQNMQEIQNQQQRNQSNTLWFEDSVSKNNNALNPPPMAVPPNSLVAQVEKHRQEIDQYLKSQNERLRLILQEQRKQQITTMMKKAELKTQAILRQKDEEIARGVSRRMQLEDLLRTVEMENQTWKRLAQENEAMVVSLNNKIEQMKERTSCCVNNNGAEDAESCCENRGGGDEYEEEEEVGETGESRIGEKELKMMMVCRGCNSRNACVLFLPCRHLCSCKACEAFLDSCPVCRTPKKANIEALIF